MPLQSSGQIALNEIHIEAGGTTGTQASLNDTDIRSLAGISSGQIAFDDFYGASGSAEFKFAMTAYANYDFDDIFFNVGAMTPAIAAGDLVVAAFSSSHTMTRTPTAVGMTMTNASSGGAIHYPGHFAAYGFYQSGDDDYVSFNGSPVGFGISAVLAVFSGVTQRLDSTIGRISSSGMPSPRTCSGASGTKLFVVTGHLEDDAVTMTAQSGYTMAGSKSQTLQYGGTYTSTTGMSYKISTSTSNENAGAFGGGGNDYNASYIMRFG